jgi:hypothetical protein
MHSLVLSRRLTSAVGMLVAAAFAVLASAPSARAATIYACVNKRTGAARLFAKEPVCKRGQARLSWNTQGHAGRNGANGKNGTNGKNGANGKNGTAGINGTNGVVAVYAASGSALVELTGKKGVTILTKTVPAGSYIVSAKTVVSSTATAPVRAASACELQDGSPGALDTAGWDTGLASDSGSFIGEATLSLQAVVSVKATTVLSLVCSDLSPDEGGQKIGAAFSQIAAVQTTQNL